MRALALACLWCASLAFAAAPAAALNSPELLFDTSLEDDVAPYRRGSASIASNGTDFLVAWVDLRERFPTIRATRVRDRGELEEADPVGIVVARDYNRDASDVVAVSDGRDYLLAFDCGSSDSPLICTAVVNAEGVVTRSPMVHAGTAPDLAWNGIEYLLVYRRSNVIEPPAPSLFARRLTRSGAAVGDEITLGIGGAVAVASDGTDYYVAWTFGEVQGRVVRAAGAVEPVRSVAMPASLSAGNVDVASDGTGYLVAWEEAFGVRLEARFVDGQGEPFGPAVLGVRWPLGEGAFSPALTWEGDRFLLAYVRHNFTVAGGMRVNAIHISDPQTVSDPFTIVDDGRRHGSPAAATSNERTLIAWAGADQIRIHDPEEGTTQIVTHSVRWQEAPVTSPSAEHDVVVWSELAGEFQVPTLYVRRAFDDVSPARVHESNRAQIQASISGGTSPMVFWLESQASTSLWAILGKRIGVDGRPSEALPVRLGETRDYYGLSVATAGDRHYVVWVSTEGQLVLTRVTQDGLVLDTTPIPLLAFRSRDVQGSPAVATDGSSLLVAWNSIADDPCSAFPCQPPFRLDVARVTLDGVLAATAAVDERDAWTPSVVWNGSEYAVFWWDQDLFGLGARRFDRRGRPIDAQAVAIDQRRWSPRPIVGWNGREYVEAEYFRDAVPYEIFVNRISRSLRVVSTVSLNNTPEERRVPALLFGRAGRGDYVLYDKLILEPPFLGTSRIIIRSLTPLPRIRAVRR